MTYTAQCAICLDTSDHCGCRWQGNGRWAPGSQAGGKPCGCVICADAAKRAELAQGGRVACPPCSAQLDKFCKPHVLVLSAARRRSRTTTGAGHAGGAHLREARG